MTRGFWPYLADWAVIALLGLLLGLVFAFMSPTHRFIVPNDPEFSYPLVPQTVPVWLLFLLALGLPLFTVFTWLLIELLIRRSSKQSPGSNVKIFFLEAHAFVLHFAFCVLLILLVVQVAKESVGLYRPNVRRQPPFVRFLMFVVSFSRSTLTLVACPGLVDMPLCLLGLCCSCLCG